MDSVNQPMILIISKRLLIIQSSNRCWTETARAAKSKMVVTDKKATSAHMGFSILPAIPISSNPDPTSLHDTPNLAMLFTIFDCST